MSAEPSDTPGLVVDAWFDLICPWCLIGKRQLDTALATWRQLHPTQAVCVRWHPVRLIDGVPPEGWDFADFYLRRLGSPQAVAARQAQVQAAAQQAGLVIAFERIRRFPDTAPAHQLLALAARRLGADAHERLMERLFGGYFQQGQHLGDRQWLLQLATDDGLDAAEVQDQLDLPLVQDAPGHGVPLFVFNQSVAVSGAQAATTLLQAIHAATRAKPNLVAT